MSTTVCAPITARTLKCVCREGLLTLAGLMWSRSVHQPQLAGTYVQASRRACGVCRIVEKKEHQCDGVSSHHTRLDSIWSDQQAFVPATKLAQRCAEVVAPLTVFCRHDGDGVPYRPHMMIRQVVVGEKKYSMLMINISIERWSYAHCLSFSPATSTMSTEVRTLPKTLRNMAAASPCVTWNRTAEWQGRPTTRLWWRRCSIALWFVESSRKATATGVGSFSAMHQGSWAANQQSQSASQPSSPSSAAYYTVQPEVSSRAARSGRWANIEHEDTH